MNDGIFTFKEFYNRGVLKMAPDALVYINGSLSSNVIAPVSGSNMTFNNGITNISVQNTMENPGASTASFEITTPTYGSKSAYWTNYKGNMEGTTVRVPILIPMMEVKIFFKGRFMVDGSPKYYVAFWGFITHVEESYSGGVYKILVNCADILHWWSYSTLNVHPNVESDIAAGGGQTLTVFSTIFETNNPFQVISTLNDNMGMHSFVTPSWVGQITPMNEIYPPGTFSPSVLGDMMTYWNTRFNNTTNLLKMYGLEGQRIDSNGIEVINPVSVKTQTGKDSEVMQALQDKDKNNFPLNTELLKNFSLFFDFTKMGDFSVSEYMTKLEIATVVKNRCHYEFFQDTNGNFVFKPPFYNLNVKGIQPYVVLPSDIINYSFSTDAEGIATVMTVTTSFEQNLFDTPFGKGVGFHMDIDLAKKYGVRPTSIHFEYIKDKEVARTLALGQLAAFNAKTLVGSVTIPGRPEMRMGYPIYMEHRDSFHYVKSIGHSFSYGGSFTTTLGLEAERRKMHNENQEVLTDRIYRLQTTDIPEKKDKKPDDPKFIYDFTQQQLDNNISSITQGGYKLEPRKLEVEKVVTITTVPFTDEDGYRVVGSFLYGRNTNALCIDNKTEPSVLKNIFLATMARPSWQSESDAMNVLFFENQEGAVPSFYLNVPRKGTNTGDADSAGDGRTMPLTLGTTAKKNTTVYDALGIDPPSLEKTKLVTDAAPDIKPLPQKTLAPLVGNIPNQTPGYVSYEYRVPGTPPPLIPGAGPLLLTQTGRKE